MPSERYDALVQAWQVKERSRYEPAAQISALLFNINRSKNAKPRSAADYMPADPTKPQDATRKTGVAATIAFVKAAWTMRKKGTQ